MKFIYIYLIMLCICVVMLNCRVGIAQETILASNVPSIGVVFQAQNQPFGQTSYEAAINNAIGVGDVNGDSFDDLLMISRCGVDNDIFELILGRPGLHGTFNVQCGFPQTAIFKAGNTTLNNEPGTIAAAGDINGDHFQDLLLAYPDYGYLADGVRSGKAFLVFGSPDIEGEHFVEEIGESIPGIVFSSSDSEDSKGLIGLSLANIGDFDGDNKIDLAISAPGSSRMNGFISGVVFIILNASNLPPKVNLADVGISIPGVKVIGGQYPCDYITDGIHYSSCGELIGKMIVPVGDVDGDGFDDVIIHTPQFFGGAKNRQYLIHGSMNPAPLMDLEEIAHGRSVDRVTVIPSPGPDELRTGCTSASVGDLNDDGYSDVAFGVTMSATVFSQVANISYILYGRPDFGSLFDIENDSLATSIYEYERASSFSRALAGPGDLDVDGIPDLLFGATKANSSYGEAYLLHGNRKFPAVVRLEDGFSGIRVIGEYPEGRFGKTVSGAGDFNGDHLLDFVITATRFVNDENDVSRAYLIYGTGGQLLPLKIDRIDPTSGPVRGGTAVQFTGQGFHGTPAIHFGNKQATAVNVLSQFVMTAVTPPGEDTGFVDVSVFIEGKTQSLPFGYEYTPNYPEINLNDLGTNGFTLKGTQEYSLGAFVDFGEVTGDGIDDLIIWKFPEVEGAAIASVVRGGTDLPEMLTAYQAGDRTIVIFNSLEGTSSFPNLRYLGDVNGDSIGDLGIAQFGAPVFILFGSQNLEAEINLDAAVDSGRAVRLDPPHDLVGYMRIMRVGDLTGDGIADLVVSNKQDAGGDQGPGEIFYVAGRTNWPKRTPLDQNGFAFSRIIGTYHDQGLGGSMKDVGDVNGDGHRDLLVAAQASSDLFVDHTAYLIYGSDHLPAFDDVESLIKAGGGVVIKPPVSSSPFVSSSFTLTGLGDVNGDHYADILIGQAQAGILYEGVSYLIYGGPKLPALIEIPENPMPPDGIVRLVGEAAYRNATSANPAGDYNNDGLADFLIGDGLYADPHGKAGNVFLILGAKGYPDRMSLGELGGRAIHITSNSDQWLVGPLVGPFGDLNGDGQTDFAIGKVPQVSLNAPDEMYLHVIFGPYGNKKFVRGDANGDGLADISDVVSILSYLYTGGEKPTCIDALDADDSGLLDITDAIYLLRFLFLGGPAPPSPFPTAGLDPTQDVYDCLGFNP